MDGYADSWMRAAYLLGLLLCPIKLWPQCANPVSQSQRAAVQDRFWMSLKRDLSRPDGPEYFAHSVKNALLPACVLGFSEFRAYVIAAIPVDQPDTLVVGFAGAVHPEAKLRLKNQDWTGARMMARVTPGTVIEFQGKAAEFSDRPFLITFDVRLEALKVVAQAATK
jgi:hypothetical protein